MKLRKWVKSGKRGYFQFKEVVLNRSCNAYNDPRQLSEIETDPDWERSSGILDKSGKEIFEGDFLETSTEPGLVVRHDEGFKFKSRNSYTNLWELTLGKDSTHLKIVGNLHENRSMDFD